MSSQQKQTTWVDAVLPFVIGGASGMFATSIIQPIDTVKVRIQLAGAKGLDSNPFTITKDILAKEGVFSFYKGLDSALLRQALYGTARLGIFKSISEDLQRKNNRNLTPLEKAVASLTAGFLGSLIGNPADLILVRMQADSSLPADQRRNYKHVGDALVRIVKEEGLFSLWKGSSPTVMRAMAMNLGMLGPYDEVKERINNYTGTKDTQSTRLIASAFAGFAGSFLCLPFDNVKTKIQSMKAGPDGKFPYSSFFDCFRKSIVKEGVTGLWVGFPTFYVRIAPHVMITLLTQDFLHGAVKKYRGH
mmetsp:Transcript_37791/g.44068  ORF Transcript_37791/g.44068 Transcript_37791/m.44068 type:complete len:304 (+) Transcript_37791:53-964(+)